MRIVSVLVVVFLLGACASEVKYCKPQSLVSCPWSHRL